MGNFSPPTLSKQTILAPLILASMACLTATAQVTPAENSQLNYRMIGFSSPIAKNTKYTLQIAEGNYSSETEFTQHLITSTNSAPNTGQCLAEVPAFGQQYTWRWVPEGKPATGAALHHFATLSAPQTDTNLYKLTITANNHKYDQAYVFLDGTRTLYNMAGQPIWYLPDIPGVVDDKSGLRDLKMTPQGTITFFANEKGYEVDYDGRLLWQAPNNGKISGDSVEHYHHELTKLSNGHYMILGTETVKWKIPAADFGSTMVVIGADGKQIPNSVSSEKLEFGTVIEYDKGGNIVWSWKSEPYFKETYELNTREKKDVLHSHENAFFFDEKNKFVYVSFKNLSQILKVQYPSGKVVTAMGKTFKAASHELADATFCEQHAIKVAANGHLLMFNNNMCNLAEPISLLEIKEAKTASGFTKIWEYAIPNPSAPARRPTMTQGGNIIELPDGNIFASDCTPYANLYIVNNAKQVQWQASAKKWNTRTQQWTDNPQYRCSIIPNRKKLEQLILSTQKTK